MAQFKQQVEQYLNQGKLDEVIDICQQALQQNQNELIAYHGLGVSLQLKGQLEEAKQWYLKILEQQPDLAEVYVNLGSLYAQQEQFEQAINAYQSALKLQPNLVQAHRNLAKIFYQMEQLELAAEHEYQVLELEPHSATAQQSFQVGNLLWKQQKLREAANCYKQAINKQPDFFEAHYNLAESLTHLKDWEEAKLAYDRVIKLNPTFERAYIGLGNILVEKAQWDEAIQNYEKAIECNPEYSWSYHRLATALAHKKEWEKARTVYQKSIELNPTAPTSYQKLGEILLEQEKWQEAAEVYQKLVELEPDSFAAHQNLGKALYQQGKALSKQQKCQESIAAYSKAIQLNPNLGSIYYNLGLSLWQMQQWEDAVAAYIQAIRLQPDEALFIHQLGELLKDKSELSIDSVLQNHFIKEESNRQEFYTFLIQLGDQLAHHYYTEAAIFIYNISCHFNTNNQEVLEKIEQAINLEQNINQKIKKAKNQVKKHPKSFQGYRELGGLLLQKNYWNESIEAYLKALELKPETGSWYYEKELWNLAQHQNKLDRVVEIYRQVLQEKPHLVNCHVHLGKALSLQDKPEAAIDCYREAGRQMTLDKLPNLNDTSKLKLNPVQSPDFIIIGAQKSGTTSLYHYLSQHPKVISSIVKEINFWSKDFDKGLDWYLAQFPPSPKRRKLLTGEASPSYLNTREAPERLSQAFPNIKLIILLRNPVNRAISHYYHWQRENWTSNSLKDGIEQDIQQLENPENDYWNQPHSYVGRGIYIRFLKKWMSLFPKEQFLIIKSEDFYEKPAKTLSQVYQFLDIPNRKIEEYKQYNSGSYSSIDTSIIKQLQAYFKPYNTELEEFLGRKFDWD
ncbi:MAG: tetratricopeptide repeat protein [Microcoleaceae cyanobacterium]